MELELKYGSGVLPLHLPDAATMDVFEPGVMSPLEDVSAALHAALGNPIEAMPLEARPTPRSVGIAVPDETRPVPVKALLPVVLERLFAAYPSLTPDAVSIVVGGGLHQPADAAQRARILPENLHGCRVMSHDAKQSPVSCFGTTSRGTPVEVNLAFGAAELKIVVGMVDAHQFVGFTGGAKGAAIGCASARMITANHSLMRDTKASVGRIDDNPVRLDLDESGERMGVNLAINVVLDAAKRPVAIFAGKPAAVMRRAAQVARQLYGLKFVDPYDIVIASCGGAPKDLCLYQAQKGLSTAMQCAAEGAKILLVAQCAQGIGDEVYHEYVKRFPCARSLKRDFEGNDFRMGAHKGYLFARATTRFQVAVHSELADTALHECLLSPGKLDKLIPAWLAKTPEARIAVIKNANSSFFYKE